jgi:hypothetical protein
LLLVLVERLEGAEASCRRTDEEEGEGESEGVRVRERERGRQGEMMRNCGGLRGNGIMMGGNGIIMRCNGMMMGGARQAYMHE